MDRLTKLDGIGQDEIIKCFGCNAETAGAMNERCGMCEHWYDITARLAEYECKGLTPREISEQTKELQDLKCKQERRLLAEQPCQQEINNIDKAIDFFEQLVNVWVGGNFAECYQTALEVLEQQKETEQMIRCKDCIKRNTKHCAMWYQCSVCGGQWSWETDNVFCSFGESEG